MIAEALTVGEAAKRLAVSRQTVTRMTELGQLRSINISLSPKKRMLRVIAADVDAMLNPDVNLYPASKQRRFV